MRKQLKRIFISLIVGAIMALIVLLALYLYTKQIEILTAILSGIAVAIIELFIQLKN